MLSSDRSRYSKSVRPNALTIEFMGAPTSRNISRNRDTDAHSCVANIYMNLVSERPAEPCSFVKVNHRILIFANSCFIFSAVMWALHAPEVLCTYVLVCFQNYPTT